RYSSSSYRISDKISLFICCSSSWLFPVFFCSDQQRRMDSYRHIAKCYTRASSLTFAKIASCDMLAFHLPIPRRTRVEPSGPVPSDTVDLGVPDVDRGQRALHGQHDRRRLLP